MSPDPAGERSDSDRRLRYLKVGALGATVVGLGVFAGLAAAGTDGGSSDHPDHHRADRHALAGDDDGGYDRAGYDADHDGRIGDPGDGGYLDDSGQPGSVGPGAGGAQSGSGSASPQEGYAPSAGGSLPSQGSSGAS